MPAIAKNPVRRTRAATSLAVRQVSFQDLALQAHAAPSTIVGLALDYPPCSVSSLHKHDRGQLMYSLSGVVTVITESGSWVVPPGQALWIPPGIMHQTRGWEPVAMRSLYMDAQTSADLPIRCQMIQVSPLLQALILEAIKLPRDRAPDERAMYIRALVLEEMRHVCPARLFVPMPADPRLLRICQALLRDPAGVGGLDEWADVGGMSRRTLTRLFRGQTGMSFSEWRQKVLLIEALSRLSRGELITSVALDLGYGSPGAFTAMFRRTLGVSPREYFRWTHAE